MSFVPPRSPRVKRAPTSRPAVWAVGRRAYLHCEGRDVTGIVLTDEAGTQAQLTLADGTPVEIVAWRPHGTGGPRYRVRQVQGDADGWVDARSLRETAAPPPPVVAGETTDDDAGVDPRTRRFGQR